MWFIWSCFAQAYKYLSLSADLASGLPYSWCLRMLWTQLLTHALAFLILFHPFMKIKTQRNNQLAVPLIYNFAFTDVVRMSCVLSHIQKMSGLREYH